MWNSNHCIPIIVSILVFMMLWRTQFDIKTFKIVLTLLHWIVLVMWIVEFHAPTQRWKREGDGGGFSHGSFTVWFLMSGRLRRFCLGDKHLVRFMARNQYAKRKLVFFKNWHSTEPVKIRLDFRKWSFLFLWKMKQIFSETCRTIKYIIIKIYFEFMVYNLETTMVRGNVQTPSSSHAYS